MKKCKKRIQILEKITVIQFLNITNATGRLISFITYRLPLMLTKMRSKPCNSDLDFFPKNFQIFSG